MGLPQGAAVTSRPLGFFCAPAYPQGDTAALGPAPTGQGAETDSWFLLKAKSLFQEVPLTLSWSKLMES